MSRLIDLTGKRFGRLTVIKRAGSRGGRALWECLCDCGKTSRVKSDSLKGGGTRSCGCLQQETRSTNGKKNTNHGMTGSREFLSWGAMLTRCFNTSCKGYGRYGGRGITVCDRWASSFENFYLDMGPRPKGMSIERVDNNKGYTPDNCIWADPNTQNRNTSGTRLNEQAVIVLRYLYKKGLKTMTELSKAYGVPLPTIHNAISGHTWGEVT